MNIVDAAVLLIAALFGLYGLTSAVEYGIVFRMLGRDKGIKRMFTPLWEVTNVFLVFGFTALAIMFNGALSSLSRLLLPTLSLAVAVMLIRACTVLAVFYVKSDADPPRWLVWLFAITTLAVPLLFSSAAIYMISGDYFWKTLLGRVLMLGTFFGLASTGHLIIERKSSRLHKLPGEIGFALWLLVLGCVLPLTVLHSATFLQQGPLLALVGLAALGLAVALADFIKRIVIESWHLAAIFCLVVPGILAWSLRPYLIAGKVTLNSAYGAQSYGSAIVIGLAVMLPLIILGLWLFARLLGFGPQKPRGKSS